MIIRMQLQSALSTQQSTSHFELVFELSNLNELPKENKQEGRTKNLVGPDIDVEFLKHFMNILMNN